MLPEPGYYWPAGALQDNDNDDIDALKRAFAEIGYEECDNGDLEAGCQKVAFYALKKDDWLHAAVQEQLERGISQHHLGPHDAGQPAKDSLTTKAGACSLSG